MKKIILLLFLVLVLAGLSTTVYILEEKSVDDLPTNTEQSQPDGNKDISIKECVATGCSGQICSDEEVITTCEWLEEYACYKNAKCELQKNGTCGWTDTSELSACLKNEK